MSNKNEPSRDETRGQLQKILEGFENAMFMTKAVDRDVLYGRPMRIAGIEDQNTLLFFTSVDSDKVDEVKNDAESYVICQSSTRHVALRGRVQVSTEKERVSRYFTKSMELWWPEGPSDPSLALLLFRIEEGEYWDLSGVKGVKFLFEAARAFVAGERPQPTAGTNVRV